MKSKAPKTAAVITIQAPGKMSKIARRDLAVWFRQHAAMLVKDGDKYTTGRFIGRYYYA